MSKAKEAEVSRLRAAVKLAHSEAEKREQALRKAGQNEKEIKLDPLYIDLTDKFWELRFSLLIAKGEAPPVINGKEYQYHYFMSHHEIEAVDLAKEAKEKLAHAKKYYKRLRKVGYFFNF